MWVAERKKMYFHSIMCRWLRFEDNKVTKKNSLKYQFIHKFFEIECLIKLDQEISGKMKYQIGEKYLFNILYL